MEALFHHVCAVERDAYGWIPRRFTPKQLEVLAREREFFGRVSRCCAGMTLECETDAEILRFTYRADLFYRQGGAFDVEEGGTITGAVTLAEPNEDGSPVYGEFVWRRRSSGTVRIYLPGNARVTIGEVDFGHWKPVQDAEGLFLFLGDSLTQSAYAMHPWSVFATRVATALGCSWLNRGVGSLYYCADTLDAEEKLQPQRVLVEFGPNDLVCRDAHNTPIAVNGQTVYHAPDDQAEILEKARVYLEKAVQMWPDARIYVMTTPWGVPYEEGSADFRACVDAYRGSMEKLAAKLHLPVIDGHRLAPHVAEMHMPDGLHYNVAGGLAMGTAITEAIRRLEA